MKLQTHRPGSKQRRLSNQEPFILEPEEHPICNEVLPLDVVWVLNRLRHAGYLAYIVGGGVRDLLLDKQPKDFDLSTNATPSQIRHLFFNCRIIGRRFKIVHIYFRDGHVIEVTTFRKLVKQKSLRTPLKDDNQFGSPSDDAWRRDLTINGLFYDHATGKIIDYTGGIEDLDDNIARIIGEPNMRFQEDPVRMIRVIRHASRLKFSIEEQTWDAICRNASKLQQCSEPRVLEEFLKELRGGHIRHSMKLFKESGLLKSFSKRLYQWQETHRKPQTKSFYRRFGSLVKPEWGTTSAMGHNLLALDKWTAQELPLSDGLRLAALFSPIAWSHVLKHGKPGVRAAQLWHKAVLNAVIPIAQDLNLKAAQKEKLVQIFQAYWRLHLLPQQKSLHTPLSKNPYTKEAALLLFLETNVRKYPCPEWLKDALPTSLHDL
ncbi:MAG: hypothetical protein CL920_07300 [Deltaproteobacteria bacterium]|nr:hypothetical protein [Deltaproteobacteria bacterium]